VVGLIGRLARRGRGRPVAAWSVLRPRRYDPAVAAGVLTAAFEDLRSTKPELRAITSPSVSRAYG